MILTIGRPDDEHVRPVVAELRRRGERVSVLDLAEIPRRARVSVSLEPGRDLRAWVDRSEDSIDLSDVRTIWLRRIGVPSVWPGQRDTHHAMAECHHLLVGLAHALRDRVRWVNPLAALALDGGWGKIRQLEAARAVGLEVPRTLCTNDPARVVDFVASCASGAVFKPFACPDGLWTTDLTPERMKRVGDVANAPGIFQEKIPKALDLRVTVMGSRVFATEIHSQALEESRVDYRRKCFKLERQSHALPDDVIDRLLRLHRDLGLPFGTGDMILTPEDRYVWLETNQAGCFLDVAATPGADLLGSFCDFLIEGV